MINILLTIIKYLVRKLSTTEVKLLGQPFYDIQVVGKFLKPNVLDTLVWNAERVRTWTQGSDTPIWGDDVYEWTGTGNGMNEYKMYYSMVISKPLIKEQGWDSPKRKN